MGLPQQRLTSSSTYAPHRAKYQSEAGHETPTTDPARSRKESDVTIYDMIQAKTQEVLAMPQVEYGAKFYVWDSKTLRIFLETSDSLKVWAMAPVGHTPAFPWRVVGWSTLITILGTECFTRADYNRFISQIKAASAHLFGTRR